MLSWLSLFVLAFAVSLDGFGVGVMYGLRKIRIPLLSIGIICVCSGIIIYSSMQIGTAISVWLPPWVARIVGAAILIGIGVWALLQMMREQNEPEVQPDATEEAVDDQTVKQLMMIELKRLGLVIQILKTPSVADMDKSGNISASEAALLGIALSLDAFGAGIGAALIGFVPFATAAVIALSSGTFLSLGLRIGFVYSEMKWIRKLSFLPGCVLILIGILKMI